ncbi:MAG: iron-only hydrogenase system regulator [Melioribacteraceae bacterium]|nr:MAG: iron-only hydrogenase system regulator [Melioribacteraceae bacterium]
MEKKHHTITITVYDRGEIYRKVGELLHQFSGNILLRVGYPVPESEASVIFLMLNCTQDELGSLSGKLGQLDKTKVKSGTLKI